jgi:hypothetical protein
MSKFMKATVLAIIFGILYASVFSTLVGKVSPVMYFGAGMIAGYTIYYLGWFLLVVIGGSAVIGLVKDNHFKKK